MSLNELSDEIHRTAVDKGWWDTPREFGTLLALVHSEVSETLEAYRDGSAEHTHYQPKGTKQEFPVRYYDSLSSEEQQRMMAEPKGISIELADVIIRVLDICAYYGIDIDDAVKRKMEYNKTRSRRHGGKQA